MYAHSSTRARLPRIAGPCVATTQAIMVNTGAAAPRLTGFSIDFGEGDIATGIINVSAETRNNADGWYSLDGRKLVGNPTQNGIYINNGKKVVIK